MKQEWKQWEGRTLGGRFPLRQFLGLSDHGAVFLTEREGGGKAAVKVVSANPADVQHRLAQMELAAVLSHPHLIQLYDMGRDKVEGAEVLFVVMEYAEEDLSQILPQRALSPAEAKEMLGPVVDVLGYLHSNGFVHGHLKPSNILAAGDQVKLSSDRVGKIGERSADVGATDAYDPPEKSRGKNAAAADVWSLGVTLCEVLTRQTPQVNGKDHGELKLPEGLSSPFLDIARNCLWRDPEQRWSIAEIASRLGSAQGQPVQKPAAVQTGFAQSVAAAPGAVVAKALPTSDQTTKSNSNRIGIAIGLVIAAILGGFLVTRHGSSSTPEATAPPSQTAETKPGKTVTPPVAQNPAEAPASSSKPASGEEIVERVVPNIPKSARDTITGKVKVRVRVDVDNSGKVVGSKFETRGPSEYFARQAKQSAERWKFAPATDEQRRWDLLFEFGRGGTQVIPSRVRGH